MPPRRRNPLGSWGLRVDLCVARRQRWPHIASSSRLELDPQAPCARHILILGQAPRIYASILLQVTGEGGNYRANRCRASIMSPASAWTDMDLDRISCGISGRAVSAKLR